MPRLKDLPARLSKINSAAINCTRLLGIAPAALGVVYHCTKKCHDRYYHVFDESLWSKVMKDVPFDAGALAGLPVRNDGPVWVAWWQGLDERTPAVIRACIDSIKRHAAGR